MSNTVTDNEIFSYLNPIYNSLIKTFGERKILGLFPTGMINYGFAESANECHLTAIYLPDFSELCIGLPKIEQYNDVDIVDIRLMYESMFNQDSAPLELIFSKFAVINPYYEKIYTEIFLANKEKIARYNPYLRIKKSRILAEKSLDPFEVSRINIACESYLNGDSCMECYEPKKEYIVSYLQAVKDGGIKVDVDKVLDEIRKKEESAENILDTDTHELVKTGILKLMDLALYQEIDIVGVVESLTDNEKKALSHIFAELEGKEDNIVSVSKMVKEAGISRPVFKNLMTKLEHKNVIKVTNHGVKGLQIDVIEKSIIKHL